MSKVNILMRKFFWGAFSAIAISASHANAQDIEEWSINHTTDAITDDVRVTAGVAVEEGLQFLLQCSSGNFGAIIAPLTPQMTMEFITMESSAEVSWRVDDRPPITSKWISVSPSASRDPVVINMSPEDMARAILQANDRLVLRVHGVTGIFNVNNSEDKVEAVMQACAVPY